MQTQNEFYKEIKTDYHLTNSSQAELKHIINYQNKRIEDLHYKLAVVENLLERIFRLRILKDSKLKLDVCTYMSAKTGVRNGQEKNSSEEKTFN